MSYRLVLALTSIMLALAACAPSAQLAPGAKNIAAQAPSVAAAAPTSTAAVPTGSPTAAPTLALTAAPAPTFAVPKAPKNSAPAMEQIATRLSEASSTPQDLEPYLQGVLSALGIPVLEAGALDLATTRLQQGLPFIFQRQVAEMAEAFREGDLYTLDSFIAAANARGARQRGTNQPLTRAFFNELFSRYTGKAQYAAGQALSAFVLALGQARARRSPSAKADPLWGDEGLDPLQTTLLLYSLSYAGAPPLPPTALGTSGSGRIAGFLRLSPLRPLAEAQTFGEHPIVGWIKDQLEDEVTGELQEQIGIPLDKKEAAQVSLCASLLLYGHKTTVTTAPDQLYHQDGSHPDVTKVSVTVRFQDDYYSKTKPIDRWLIEKLGNCDLPVQGLARGAQLDWSVSDGLLKHGRFDVTQSETDLNGSAWATWRTVPETTPKELRSIYTQQEAVGSAIVRVSGLVPGWGSLEKIVNLLHDTGAVGQARLAVTYYETPAYRVDSVFGLYSKVPVQGDICALDKPFTLQVDGRNPSGGSYIGTFKFTPQGLRSGSWVHAATSCMPGGTCGAESGSSTYQVEGIAEGKPVLKMDATTAFSAVKGYTGSWPWPEWEIELKPITGSCNPE